MSDRVVELRTILADVRRRWARRAWLRAWTLGAATAAAMLLVGVFTVWLVARDGVPLVLAVGAVLAMAVVSLVCALLPLRRRPTDRQIARFIEERTGGLDDVLVTAVEHGAHHEGSVAGVLVNDAIRVARQIDSTVVVGRDTLRSAAVGAVLGSAGLIVALGLFAPPANRAGHVVGAYWFPSRYVIEVAPGSVKVRAGEPLTIVARVPGTDGGLVPVLTVGAGADARSVRMTAGDSPGEFTITLANLTATFPYAVVAGSARSADYTVEVIRPVRVSRIDLSFEYPAGIGLAPHTEEDAGDIYAPAGTRVQVKVTADKPLMRAELNMAGGAAVPMEGTGNVVTADLVIANDGSYRVSLNDLDGLSSEGDTEYFIRMLDDRPPDVRILRPAGDRQVSPLEEVVIEARADDDYGLASLELVLRTSTGTETVVPLGAPVSGAIATGGHTLYLEDLRVTPGDFVIYHARARDRGRGRRGAESRSDIYFLEVKPYEEEFVASDSQAGGGMAQETGVDELAAMQKDIIAATWKLDARSRRARDARSAQDIRAVATAQTALRARAADAAAEVARAASPPRRRRLALPGLAPAGDNPMARAVEAMGRAAGELNRLETAAALPHEEEALSHLLKAAAEIRRRQIQRQQAQGRGGNGNRQQPDLSTLFDQELRKKQQTNYETPETTEARNDPAEDADPLADIRELARQQDALARQQQELAARRDQLAADDLKRQLDRLTREQNELREQAEQLARQMASQPAQGGRTSSAEGRKMSEISDEMRNAARDLGRQDPRQASERADRALRQLRSLEQQMQGARPGERRRALGDLQLEARQLADAERRLGNEATQTGPGGAGEDARRRLAAEQERLADRTDRLRDNVTRLANGAADAGVDEFDDGAQDRRQAMAEASRELTGQRLAEQMRDSATALRGASEADVAEASVKTAAVARALDKVAERLGAAAGARDGEATRLSEQLARTQELRDRLGELQRTMDALDRTGESPGAEGAAEGRAGSVARLQREVDDQMREAQRLADEVRRQAPAMPDGGSTPEQWQRSPSAPGTEAFKQDFEKWESLKNNLLAALERTETQVSAELRMREQQQRLNAGGHVAVSDTYRDLVDRYYQSLAAPRRPQR